MQSRNTRRGGGPRTAAGKAIASRNALRHGFAAQLNARPSAPEKVERLAHAIGGSDLDPAILSQAFKIAEDAQLLSDIAMHKARILESLRESEAKDGDDRDGYEAWEAALQAIIRLDRYVQRAWLRQKRAIRQLASIELERRFQKSAAPV
jgi:hypothetical protein